LQVMAPQSLAQIIGSDSPLWCKISQYLVV